MTQYTTTATFRVNDSALRFRLSEKQTADRAHLLIRHGDGTFSSKEGAALEFKKGERLGIDGDLPKGLRDKLETDAPAAVDSAADEGAQDAAEARGPKAKRGSKPAGE